MSQPQNTPSLTQDYLGADVDRLVDEAKPFISILEPVVDSIPLVKTLLASLKYPRTISDFILGKKVYAFLYSSNLSGEKIEKLQGRLSRYKHKRLWEQVVLAINTHDNIIKTKIVGKLFKALLDDVINETEFSRMVHATNNIDVGDLDELKEYYSLSTHKGLTSSQIYSFVMFGLIDVDNSGIGGYDSSGAIYPTNQLGWRYVGIVYDYPESKISGIKIGVDDLVPAISPETNGKTGKSYPLDYVKKMGYMYEEVDLFIVNDKKELLCEVDGLPAIIDSRVPPSGESTNATALKLAEPYGKRIHGVTSSNVGVGLIKTAYILKCNEPIQKLSFRSVDDISKAMNLMDPTDEKIKYLTSFNEQIKRYANGELDVFWNSF